MLKRAAGIANDRRGGASTVAVSTQRSAFSNGPRVEREWNKAETALQATDRGWRERERQSPNRVFVAVEATHISVVYLRGTLELLAKAAPGTMFVFSSLLRHTVDGNALVHRHRYRS
jgi:hypothetical protein